MDYERYGLTREDLNELGRIIAERLGAPNLSEMTDTDFEWIAIGTFEYRAEHGQDPRDWDATLLASQRAGAAARGL